MKINEKYIQICPICGSEKINFYKDDKAVEPAGIETYECKRCRNIFAFPLELTKKEASKLKQIPLTKSMIRSTPPEAIIPVGLVEIGANWKFLGLIMAFIGLFLFIASFNPIHCYYTEEIICSKNTNPFLFASLGSAIFFAGIYLIIESFALTQMKFKQGAVLKIGVVLALAISSIATTLIYFL